MIKLMDITESLASHKTVITDIREFEFDERFPGYDENIQQDVWYVCDFTYLYLDDNIYHTMEITNGDFYELLKMPIQYRIRHDTAFVEKPSILTDQEKLVGPTYNSKFNRCHYRHPKRNLIIELFMFSDYIAFLDLDNNRRFFVHQKDATTFDQELETKVFTDHGESFTGPAFVRFTNATPTESFFMATYYNALGDESDVKPELLFFDWDGNFLKSVRLSMVTRFNAYDPKTKTLYGIDFHSEDEPLVSFDLSTIIDW